MDRTQRLSLLAAIMGSFVVGLDATVVNVALPAIEEDLGGGLAGQQWVLNGYLLALASLILVGGSLGDMFGERRVFSLGVLGFGVSSIVCALAPSIEVLVAGRVLQGVFGALLTPSALAVIVAAFPPAQRGAAVGSWTAWSGIATVVGPLVGGQLIDAASWRWIFAINVPFVVVTLVLVAIAVPQRARPARGRRSTGSARVLSFLALAGPTLALIRQPRVGLGRARRRSGPASAGSRSSAPSSWREATTPYPMLPLELFGGATSPPATCRRSRCTPGCRCCFFYLVLFLQQVAGYTRSRRGSRRCRPRSSCSLLSKRAGALADRYGPRAVHGRRRARRGRRPAPAAARRRRRRLRHRAAAGAARVLARAGGDRRAADRDGARRRRRGARRASPRASTTRSRARPGCSASPRSAPSSRRSSRAALRRAARRVVALAGGPGRRCAEAEERDAGARRRLGPAAARGGERRRGRPRRPRSARSTPAWGSAPRSSASAASSASRSCATRAARSAAPTARAASSWPRRPTPCASARPVAVAA